MKLHDDGHAALTKEMGMPARGITIYKLYDFII